VRQLRQQNEQGKEENKNKMHLICFVQIDVGLWLYEVCALFANALHSRLSRAQAVAAEPLLGTVPDLMGAFA
jgi:hypothetical protein